MLRKIGQFDISADGDLILVWSSPEFNLETAQEFAAAMAAMIDRMPPAFGVMARFDSPPIIGPDVEESMRDAARHRARRGMAAIAFLIAQGPGYSVSHGQWDRIYKASGIKYAFFDDVESARTWLREQIQAAI